MWAPADLFNRPVNAILLILKQLTTLVWNNIPLLSIVAVVLVAVIVVIGQFRRSPRD